ncbi:hypothetical protein CZ771_13590 [Actinomycetales bacterium JB111]|nr:hypothetical protein CZ771_13590 [Actinomycetales bacterium JB111]
MSVDAGWLRPLVLATPAPTGVGPLPVRPADRGRPREVGAGAAVCGHA